MSGERGTVRRGLAALLASFLVLAGLHVLLVPAFEGPDEPDNVEYVRFLHLEGRPAQPSVEVTHELENLGRGQMPPLWYATLLPLYRALGADAWTPTPVRNPGFLRHPDFKARVAAEGLDLSAALAEPKGRLWLLHGPDEARPLTGPSLDLRLLRLTTVAWGALAVLAVFLVARRTLGCARRALWVAALAAWTPQLQFLSGTLTMDPMCAALGGLGLWGLVEWVSLPREVTARRAVGWAVVAGAGVGLAMATKLNGFVLLPVLALGALLAPRAGRTRASLAAGAALLLTAGPYWLWAWAESGHPLWPWVYQRISPFHNTGAGAPTAWGLETVSVYVQTLFLTWFADFGWTSVWFPAVVSLPLLVLTVAAGGLGVVALVRGGLARSEAPVGAPRALLLVAFAVVAIQAAELWFNLSFSQPQGRHLYPFLPALYVALAVGLDRLRLLRPFALASLVLSIVALPLLVGRLRPEGWAGAWAEARGIATTDAGRRPDVTVEPGQARVAWRTDPAAPGDPPVLAWVPATGGPCELVLSLDPRLEDRPWREGGGLVRATEELGRALGDAFPLPADFWTSLSAGASLYAQVIELGADGRAVGHSTVLELRR